MPGRRSGIVAYRATEMASLGQKADRLGLRKGANRSGCQAKSRRRGGV